MNDLCAVFDIDDTLYLERDYVRSGFRAAGLWAATWLGVTDFADRCWRAHESGRQGSIFNTVLDECGIAITPGLTGALITVYRTHEPRISLCPDAADALAEIEKTMPIAVISDGPAISQSRKAESLGLLRCARPVLLTELLGPECGKPSRIAFERVQQEVAARRFVYIADNPLKDFTAPAKLGWRTVRIRRQGGLHAALENTIVAPDYEMKDCAALPRLLREI